MSKTKITTPVPGFSGTGVAGLQFDNGVAYTDDDAILNYCRQAGYGIGDEQEAGEHPLNPSELAELRRQSLILAPSLDPSISDEDLQHLLDEQGISPSEVREALAEPADPRALDNGGLVQVGTPLRDASVDPEPGDFLPPTNAGKANPHGPLVVAPTIHGSGVKPIRPGEVHVDDTDKQQVHELDQADKTLVQQIPAHEVLPTFNAPDENGEGGSDTGPLGLSDPGSVAMGVAAATAVDYDPADYGVDEVNSYLDESTAQERTRVLELEAGDDGKQRKGILEGRHAQTSDEDWRAVFVKKSGQVILIEDGTLPYWQSQGWSQVADADTVAAPSGDTPTSVTPGTGTSVAPVLKLSSPASGAKQTSMTLFAPLSNDFSQYAAYAAPQIEHAHWFKTTDADVTLAAAASIYGDVPVPSADLIAAEGATGDALVIGWTVYVTDADTGVSYGFFSDQLDLSAGANNMSGLVTFDTLPAWITVATGAVTLTGDHSYSVSITATVDLDYRSPWRN